MSPILYLLAFIPQIYWLQVSGFLNPQDCLDLVLHLASAILSSLDAVLKFAEHRLLAAQLPFIIVGGRTEPPQRLHHVSSLNRPQDLYPAAGSPIALAIHTDSPHHGVQRCGSFAVWGQEKKVK